MTMMKKKMATNLASATATLKPETRMENMILDFYPVTKMGDTGEALKYSARMLRHLQPSEPSIIYHRTQEAKEKAKAKKRGLYDPPAAGEKVRAGGKSYLPTILHP
jgi:hypothetical protein